MAASWPVKPGYRSATKYHLCDEQVDAIIEAAVYHPHRFVLHFSIDDHNRVVPMAPPSRAPPSAFIPTCNAIKPGVLDRLPAELQYEVLLHMDMQSLFELRQTGRGWRQAVHCFTPYHRVTRHGRDLFCALLRTGLGADVSLSAFYGALCTKTCALCGNFAGFVSLLTWTRCCFHCLRVAAETQVRSFSTAKKQFKLSKADSKRLRAFKTMKAFSSGSRIAVVSLHQARLLSKVTPDPTDQQLVPISTRSYRYNLKGACALPYYDRKTGKVEDGMQCGGCQGVANQYRRFPHMPHQGWEDQARNQMFTRDEFLEHFRWCGLAQDMWRWRSERTSEHPANE